MPQPDAQVIARKFQDDINQISRDFIAAFALKFRQEVDSLNSPLHRWLDFRFRYIDPQPRQVVFSDNFPKNNLPSKAKVGLEHIVSLIRGGYDINPYQGRGLILRNDTSSLKKNSRTDLLWADWGVLHFHLTADPIPNNQFFSKPADYLAFCIVGGDIIAFIDILPHPKAEGFANPKLMETIHRNWPEYLEQFVIKGIVGLSGEHPKSEEDIHTLRTNGVGYFLTFDNKVYASPGMGVTMAATSSKITIACNRIQKYVETLTQMVSDPNGQFQTEIGRLIEDKPRFSLAITPAGLAVYEEITTYAFLLPKAQFSEENTFLNEIQNLIAPDWAVQLLASK